MNRILIISVAEQAIRLHQTYQNLGFETVAIYSKENYQDVYIKIANHTVKIANNMTFDHRKFFYTYITIAKYTGCQFIHPGTDELVTNQYFAEACELSGLTLLGNLSQSLRRLKKIPFNKQIGRLHKKPYSPISNAFSEIHIIPSKSFQLIYSSIGNKNASYLGSVEFYKRNSQSKNVYITSPCQSVQVNDFIHLNRFCREIIYQFQLIGIIYFDFIFNQDNFYLKTITPTLSPYSDTLESRLGYDFIEAQADIFINGQIKYFRKKNESSVSKNIYVNKEDTVEKILYPGGHNIRCTVNAYKGEKLMTLFPFPLAIITAYAHSNLVVRLIEATKSFRINTY